MQINDVEVIGCAVCLENNKISYSCGHCKSCNVCIDCIASMQEHGMAGKCPICRKSSPWCNNLDVVINDKPKRINYTLCIPLCCYRSIQVIAIFTMLWCVGFTYVYASGISFTLTGSHLIVNIFMFIIIGILIMIIILMIISMVGICAITCLTIASSES